MPGFSPHSHSQRPGVSAAAAVSAIGLGAAALLAGCGAGEASSEGTVNVVAADDSCELARTTVAAGTITPGQTRDLTVVLEAGSYVTACKPGSTGLGIRSQLDVTEDGSGGAATDDPALVAASAAYVAWVAGEAQQLLTETRAFEAAVTAADVEQAKGVYAATRMRWERIEPVAESFGDLDPRMDAREGDLEEGVPWTGWHRLEKDLWVSGLQTDSSALAAELVTDTEDLVARVATLGLTADKVTNGAKELLDEVATGKITGEEERYSHTDLWDFQANVEGAQKAYAVMADVVVAKDPKLAQTLETEFSALLGALSAYRQGDGFVLYTELTPEQVRELSARVEALSEPLAELTRAALR